MSEEILINVTPQETRIAMMENGVVQELQIERSSSMGAYQPSSMIDFEMRRPVEVEAIWGEPWRQGVAAGAAMPRTEALYRLITHLAKVRSAGAR